MKICHNWLQRYINLDIAPQKISYAFTERGIEVENIEMTDIDLVVTAKVISKSTHPNANKLSICQIDNGVEILPVICGAPNVKKGQIILLAQVGAVLPGNFKIKKSKIRGETSYGMLCAEDELGLGKSHEGIMILDTSIPVGQPLRNLFSPVYELGITPNRPDALSHIGCARELASYFNKTLTIPKSKQNVPISKHTHCNVQVKDDKFCSFYTSYIIKNVKIEPSPEWLQKSLQNVHLQSINNIVDLTNFVLMEFGQPSHAFDLNRIKGSQLNLRYAKDKEKLTTLDGIARELDSQDFVIADSENALSLAGVIGGEKSKITKNTTNILLEVAYFDPTMVRKQAKRHQLSTDSSFRFERGIDPISVETTANYLAEMITELAGGKIISKEVQQSSEHPTKNRVITLRKERIQKILGLEIDWLKIVTLLKSIGIEIENNQINPSTPSQNFVILSSRVDIIREIDLIENIARLFNFNQIPTIFPQLPHKATKPLFINQISTQIRNFLSKNGLNECLHLRFVPQDHQTALYQGQQTEQKTVSILNALNPKENALPTSLIYNLLKSSQFNYNQQSTFCRFFEIGKVFHQDLNSDTKVKEKNNLAVLINGYWKDSKWISENQKSNFHILKGLIQNLFLDLKQTILFTPSKNTLLHPRESLDIQYNRKVIGFLGTLHLQTQKEFAIKEDSWICEISLDALKSVKTIPKFKVISMYSKVSREMNIVLPQETTHQEVLNWIKKIKTPCLTNVELNSVYQGSEVPKGKKAVHYSFFYQSLEATLTDKVVNQYQEDLANQLQKQPEITFK